MAAQRFTVYIHKNKEVAQRKCRKLRVNFFLPLSFPLPILFFFPSFLFSQLTGQIQMKTADLLYELQRTKQKNDQKKVTFCYFITSCSCQNWLNQLILLTYKYKINKRFKIQRNKHHSWSDNVFITVNDFPMDFSPLKSLKVKKNTLDLVCFFEVWIIALRVI